MMIFKKHKWLVMLTLVFYSMTIVDLSALAVSSGLKNTEFVKNIKLIAGEKETKDEKYFSGRIFESLEKFKSKFLGIKKYFSFGLIPLVIGIAGVKMIPGISASNTPNNSLSIYPDVDYLINVKEPFSLNINSTELFGFPSENGLVIKKSDDMSLPEWISSSPSLISSINTQGTPYGLTVEGDNLFIADYNNGMRIANISDVLNPEIISGYDTSGLAGEVMVKDGTAYIADYLAGIHLVDVRNILSPSLLGSFDTTGSAVGLQPVGNILYIADGSPGLKILNVLDTAHPFLLGTFDSRYANDVEINDDIAYIADGGSGMRIVNITDSVTPFEISVYDTPGTANAVAVEDNIAIIADEGSGLHFVNVTEPNNPFLIGQIDLPGNMERIIARNQTVYVADGSKGINIVDFSFPDKPFLAGNYEATGYARGIDLKGNKLFIGDDSGQGVKIISLNRWKLSGTPALEDSETFEINVDAVNVQGALETKTYKICVNAFPELNNYLIDRSVDIGKSISVDVISDYNFKDSNGDFLDIIVSTEDGPDLPSWLSWGNNIIKKGSYLFEGEGKDISISGNLAYIADSSNGLQIIDISNPAETSLMGNYITPAGAFAVEVRGERAYLVDGGNTFHVLNITDPANPEGMGTCFLTEQARDIEIKDNYAIISDTLEGIKIIDINNPESPSIIGSYNTDGSSYGIAVKDDYLYIADRDKGLKILDISNPELPVLRKQFNTDNNFVYDIDISGNVAFMAVSNGGVKIIDISDPDNPLLIKTVTTPGTANKLKVRGNRAYVADLEGGMHIINIANLSSAYILSSFTDISDASCVQLKNDNAYVIDSSNGLIILNVGEFKISGIPEIEDVENIEIKVTATDPMGAEISDFFTLRVEGAPTLSNPISNKIAKIGQNFNFFVDQDTFSDPNGDLLMFSAVQGDNTALPEWLKFNPVSGGFAGVPGKNDNGTISIKITANDRVTGTVADTFDLLIDNMPELNKPIDDYPADIGKMFNFTLPVDTFIDIDGDALNFKVSLNDGEPLPDWLTFNNETNVFSGIPALEDSGQIIIKVEADDGKNGVVSDVFNINVEKFPVVINPIGLQGADIGKIFTYTIPENTFTDEYGDRQALKYSVSLSNGDNLPDWLRFNHPGKTFIGVPLEEDEGSLSVLVTAEDEKGGSVSEEFNIEVHKFPVMNNIIPNQNADIEKPFAFNIIEDIYFSYEGPDSLNYTALLSDGSSLPDWLEFNSETFRFSGFPETSDQGVLDIVLTAYDSFGGSVSDVFSITIQNFPFILNSILDQSAAIGRDFNFKIPEDTFFDKDDDILYFSAVLANNDKLPEWLKFNQYTRSFTGTPDNSNNEILNIKVYAQDGNGGKASDIFDIDVHNYPVLNEKLKGGSGSSGSSGS